MYPIENKTILNDTISFMNSEMGPSATQTQLTQNILNAIQQGRRNFKPNKPAQMCQYPNMRTDEFNMNEGLGTVSLQPIIDQLNAFKQAAINEIKTKFQAMGPENSKDIKLAAGAVSLITEVYNAAQCYTKVVTNVNNLISGYIQTINIMVVNVVQKINSLEEEINTLKLSFLQNTSITNYIIGLAGNSFIQRIQSTTNLFDILGAIVELQNALGQAELVTTTLLNSPKRIQMQLTIALTMLENRINSFLYYQGLSGALNQSISSAQNLIMTDDYLSDFSYTTAQESSYNWSLTNSGGLSNYNSFDSLTLIPRLNAMMHSYKRGTSNPLIIDSRDESGYIVVAENSDGLISGGLDPRAGYDIGLIFELSINNGETIIRSNIRGENLNINDIVVKKEIGQYYNYGPGSFDYNKVIINSSGSFTVFLTDNTKISEIQIGKNYFYIDPVTNTPWNFSWDSTTGLQPRYFPVLFNILDKTANSITIKVLGSQDLNVSDYIMGALSTDYTFNNRGYTSVPGDANGMVTSYIKDTNGDYLVTDQYGVQIYSGGLPATLSTTVVTDPVAWNNMIGQTQFVMYVQLYSVTLNKYIQNSSINQVPHSGEQIKSKNWILSVYPVGDETKINKIQFSSEYPGLQPYLFFLKAKWGFIPDES